MFGGVDEAKVVGAHSALLQIGSEERGGEAGAGVGEESLLLDRFDGVDGVEGEAEQAVVEGVLLELGGDGLGEFDGLPVDGRSAHGDGVGVDVA